jgi:GNAT superfamily N-acetyltransferase
MNVWVHPDQRGQRIGETIYREVATILSENGIERVNGTVIDDVGRPFKIRERVFGNIEREGDFDVVSRIAPGQLFQPSNDPRALKLAAIRFPDGKVFTGPAHAFAWYAAEAEGYPSYNDILPESQIPEDGFVTNDGEFLNRNEAAERALELKQISEADAPRVLFPIGSAGEGLEAIRFQKYRQFQPAKPQTDFGEGIVAREGVRLATSRREASDGATLFSLSIIKPIDTLMAGEIGVPKPGWPAPEGFQWLSPETGGVVSKKGQLAEIGYIHYAVDSDWSDATVDGIRVAPMFQNRGFGEALYREAAAHLQSEGVRRVFGDIVDPAKRPQKLRERVFGDAPQTVRSQTTPGGILAVNRIDPLRRFLPSSDPRAIKTAAILLATGKIYEGMMHAFAFNEATEAGESLDNSITGFVTNDGEFLDRVQALQRAADLRQIPEDVLQNYTVGDVIGQEGEGGADYRGLDPTTPILESLQLDGTRRFMPVSFDDFAGDEKAVKAALNSDGWAIITATQEAIGDDQHPDNIAANAQLRSELLAVGADIIELEGFYKGLDQGTSYLVTGLSEDRIRAFGRKYNQESILTPTGLIFSDGTIVPARPSRNQVGEHAAKADFYSRLPSGISFSLGLDWSALQPETRTRRGIRRTLSVDKAPAIWILPNGQIVQATSLHERHLAENAGELNKRFGTDFSTVESVDERNKALRAGFVRVRYRPETGELVIELGPGTLRRQRAAIESLLLNNAEKADRVSISVLDTSGGKVRQVNYSDARLFDAEDPVAASIAALDELAESGRFQPAKPIALPDDPAEAARRLQKESSPETLNYYRVMVNIRPPATEKGLFGKAEGVVESKPEWVVAKNPTEARRVVRGRVLSREAEGYSVTLKEPELNSSFDFPYLTGRKVDGVPTVSARKFPDTLSPEKVASRYDDLFESVDKAVSFADKLPNLGYTPAEWNAAMAVALNGSKGYVPPAPLRLHEWMQDPQAFRDFLGQADRSIVDAAIGGLNGLKPVQERSKAGGIPVEMVALHFTWGILSRMLDPVNQEAGWIRLTSNPEFNRALADSIDGKFSMTKDQWKALVAESMSDTSVATGRAATANANVIHSMLTSWNGRWRELADVINSAELSGPEMRREFFRRGFAKGSGIQHKVLSFVLATLARSDMFILDRWQAVSMWFPSVKEAARRRAEQGTGSADPIVRLSDGTPEDTTGIYDILTKKGGLSDTTVAEAVYAMVERGLKLVLEANRDYLTELLGREPTVFDLHWLTWNVIKEEGVGHSSLDSTSQALDQGGIYGTEQFPERFADIPKRTEGRGTIRGRPVWQTFTGQRGSPANLEIRPLDRGAAERAGSLGEQAILSL